MIPPEYAQILVDRRCETHLVEHPEDTGRRVLIGVIGIEVEGRREVRTRRQRGGDIGRNGRLERIEVDVLTQSENDGDDVRSGGDTGADLTARDDDVGVRERAIERRLGVVIELDSGQAGVGREESADIQIMRDG